MMPRITRPQVCRVVREMLPRERFGPDELLRWLEDERRIVTNEPDAPNGSGRMSCCGGWRKRRIVTNEPDAPMPSAAPPAVATPPASLIEPSL